jgi:predicted metalloendopeptidase
LKIHNTKRDGGVAKSTAKEKKKKAAEKLHIPTSLRVFINVRNVPKKYLTFLENSSEQEESNQKASCF